jgi:hypothetical protein
MIATVTGLPVAFFAGAELEAALGVVLVLAPALLASALGAALELELDELPHALTRSAAPTSVKSSATARRSAKTRLFITTSPRVAQ